MTRTLGVSMFGRMANKEGKSVYNAEKAKRSLALPREWLETSESGSKQ